MPGGLSRVSRLSGAQRRGADARKIGNSCAIVRVRTFAHDRKSLIEKEL